jgi:FtsZ-interacting cell division protein ZipA
MKKNIVYITIMVMATIIIIASVAGCNTSCNNNKVPYEKEPITGEVIATSEVDGSKVAIIETEVNGVKVTETSIVTDDKEVKIGETITTSETTVETTVATTTTTPTTTTTTKETEATPTPKPNYTNNDINFGNDESAASEYQGNNGGTVETTAAPTATPEPTATPVPTATPEPTATPTPEPTETEPAPTEPEPQTEYKTVTVKWNATDFDNNTYTGSISGVGVHRDPGCSWTYDNVADVKARVKADIAATIPGGWDECAGYAYSF